MPRKILAAVRGQIAWWKLAPLCWAVAIGLVIVRQLDPDGTQWLGAICLLSTMGLAGSMRSSMYRLSRRGSVSLINLPASARSEDPDMPFVVAPAKLRFQEFSCPQGTISVLIDSVKGVMEIFCEQEVDPLDWDIACALLASLNLRLGEGPSYLKGVDVFTIKMRAQR